ncbi:rod shape-determining protein MreC [Candidatus Parcubacteria bacterium]|nr:rod shape-determining protein MreC [Candidatus Parcubacteria bacterium]
MKTRYPRNRNHIFSARGVIVFALVVAVTLVMVFLRFVFPSTFSALTAPLLHVGSYVLAPAVSFEDAGRVAAERDRLKEENQTLHNEKEALLAQLREGEASQEDTRLFARVLSRPPVTPYDVLVLDVGSADGVSMGAAVFGQGVPVGIIAQVEEKTSRALLFSAAGGTNEGAVGESRLPITLRGEGAGAFSSDVPKEVPVTVGDSVFISPGASPLGTVVHIEESASAPQKTLVIRPFANPFMLTTVDIAL